MLQLKNNEYDSPAHLTELLEIQQDVIAKIALGSNLKDTLNDICSGIEAIFSDKRAKSSVLLIEGIHLRDGAAPSLPRAYVELIDGLEIGPTVGSCGTAAFTKKRYIASDTKTDPHWQPYQVLVESFNLNACWSTPIISSEQEVLGTFAVYYDVPMTPNDSELKVIDRFSHLTGLAIEKDRALRRERELNSRLTYNLEKIQKLAYSDSLTGLPNRRFVLDRLLSMMKAKADHANIGALLYLDLDNFKGVNDTLGHSTGDILLTEIGQRLNIRLEPQDTIARIGGDEFVVLLSRNTDDEAELTEDATQIAAELLTRLDTTFTINHRELHIAASIGITLISADDNHADEVLMRADTAMYSAKRNSEQTYCFFDPKLHESLRRRLKLERELRYAINNREIDTYFQPKIAPDGSILGAEALVRWFHPGIGPVSPIEFIAIAEEIGVIDDLQKIVMEEACGLLHTIESEGLDLPKFTLSINVSADQFKYPAFVCELRQLFNKQNISPEQITLELTESMLVEDIESAVKQMGALKSLGFNLSIDDFGTGYSSLAYLQTFPIDELKIDKSFVDNLFKKKIGTGIIDTILSLAEHMNYDVVAEGVEEKEQVDYFKQKNITSMQGYYFAKPMPATELLSWIAGRVEV